MLDRTLPPLLSLLSCFSWADAPKTEAIKQEQRRKGDWEEEVLCSLFSQSVSQVLPLQSLPLCLATHTLSHSLTLIHSLPLLFLIFPFSSHWKLLVQHAAACPTGPLLLSAIPFFYSLSPPLHHSSFSLHSHTHCPMHSISYHAMQSPLACPVYGVCSHCLSLFSPAHTLKQTLSPSPFSVKLVLQSHAEQAVVMMMRLNGICGMACGQVEG